MMSQTGRNPIGRHGPEAYRATVSDGRIQKKNGLHRILRDIYGQLRCELVNDKRAQILRAAIPGSLKPLGQRRPGAVVPAQLISVCNHQNHRKTPPPEGNR